MASVINLETFAAAISDENSVGKDIRQDSTLNPLYYQIKDARNAARTIERKNQMGESDADPRPQWDIVFTVGSKILQNHSKDLEIAAWLTEALIRRYGFAGLGSGFELMKVLVSQYWDSGLYPLADEEGIEVRVLPISGLTGAEAEGSLLFPIRDAKITDSTGAGSFSLWQYKQAMELGNVKDEKTRDKKISQGVTTLEKVQKAMAESGATFYQKLLGDLKYAVDAFKELNTVLHEKCGKLAPNSSQVNGLLEDFNDHIGFLLKDAAFSVTLAPVAQELPEPMVEEISSETTLADVESKQVQIPKQLNIKGVSSRKEVLQLLSQIAAYFKENEPQSPLACSIERVVRWGNLPFAQLVQELIEESARPNFEKLTGVITPSAEVTK